MQFVILRKADADTEAGKLPSEELIAAMVDFHQEMADARILVGGEGLRPSAKGARVKFSAGKPTVVDGPFTETKELVAGFTIIDVASFDEALEWAKRWPAIDNESEVELEIRAVVTEDDFEEAFTPELREREQRMRDQIRQDS